MSDHLDPAELAHLDRCKGDVERARIVLSSFGTYLAGKYQLGQGDKVAPDGSILRAETENGRPVEQEGEA